MSDAQVNWKTNNRCMGTIRLTVLNKININERRKWKIRLEIEVYRIKVQKILPLLLAVTPNQLVRTMFYERHRANSPQDLSFQRTASQSIFSFENVENFREENRK